MILDRKDITLKQLSIITCVILLISHINIIFDIKGKKIIDEKTNNGRLNIYLPHLGLYRVIAIPKNNLIYKITCTNILLHKNSCPILHLSFDKIYSSKWISLILF